MARSGERGKRQEGRGEEEGGGRRRRRSRPQCSIQNENPTQEGWEKCPWNKWGPIALTSAICNRENFRAGPEMPPPRLRPGAKKKVFLEHVGNVPDNIVPDVLPTWKKCSDNIYWNMFRANVPGHWFLCSGPVIFLTRACRRSLGGHVRVRKGTGPQHVFGHAVLRCSNPQKLLRTCFGRPTRMLGRVVTARVLGPQDRVLTGPGPKF